jgi:hypothetical protein
MIAQCEPILDTIYGQDIRGTLMNDIRTLDNNINDIPEEIRKWKHDEIKLKPLDEETHNALVAFATARNVEGWTPQRNAILRTHCRIRGIQYTRSTAGKKDSVIFFQPTNDEHLVPGVIRQIISIPRVNTDGSEVQGILLAVQRYKPLVEADRIGNPFHRFEDFGAGLWHDITGKVEIVTLSQKICHAIHRKWDNNILVMRPLNRVSYIKRLTIKSLIGW